MLNADTNLIGTMQEFKEDMYGYISDASKDAQGFRTRFDYTTWTAEELMAEAVYWEGRVVETMDREAIEEAAAKVEFETAITNTIANGAADRDTAIRWMYQGETISENWNMGTEHWLWGWGLSFEDIRGYENEFRNAFNAIPLLEDVPEIKAHSIPKYNENELTTAT